MSILAAAILILGRAAFAIRRVRGAWVTVTGTGESMSPAHRPGDQVLVSRRSAGSARPGQVVVVERPDPATGWSELPPLDRGVVGRVWHIKRVGDVRAATITA